jgi:VWFA-related protein
MRSAAVALTALVGLVSFWVTRPMAQQAPVFRAGVDLIRVDVSVLDRDHQPVHGLTAADFTVREDEKPQTIEAFSEVRLPEPVEPPAQWMKRAAPDVITNELHDNRIVVIVLDDAVIPQDQQMAAATKTIARDVVSHLGAGDLACVIYTAANRQKAQNFTTDHTLLLAAIERFAPGFASFGIDGDDSPFFEDSESVVHDVADFLVALPQRRKTLVYISTGVPVDPAANAPVLVGRGADSNLGQREAMLRLYDDMQETFRRAQRANVAIYPINPAGPAGIYNFAMNRLLLKRLQAQAAMDKAHEIERLTLDFLLQYADNTAGRATVNTNDYSSGIAQLFRENGSYYLLGFRQTDPKGPGKFSRLDVTVNRTGLEVRSRKLNYTPKPEPRLEKASAVQRAIAGLLPNPDSPMRVSVAAFAKAVDPTLPDKAKKAAQGDTTVAIVLAVDEAAPMQRVVEHVDLLTRAFSVEGDSRGTHSQAADVTIRPATSATGRLPQFARYEVLTEITLKPGRYQLRFAADNTSQVKTGSVFADVDVPDFSMEPLSLSGVVMSSAGAPFAAPKDALIGVVPIVPTTDREFENQGHATAFLRVYQGAKAALLPVAIAISILDEHDAKVFSSNRTLMPNSFAALRGADVQLDLPLPQLKLGRHLLVFEAAAGKLTSRREVVFSVK